ncbi:MAG: hypothetical protein MJ211_10810 [Bacteroidales bacterium]|nr:hypothetical protein [Bacteroidales bacterium]
MKKLLILFILLSTFYNFSYSQQFQGTAQGKALAEATSTLLDINSTHYNIAGTAFCKLGAILSYHNKFFIKELSQKNIATTIPFCNGVLSLSANYYGYKLCNETQFGLGYAMKLSNKISAGIKINYLNNHIKSETEKHNSINCETGIIYCPIKKLKFGAYLYNPTNTQLSNCDSIIPIKINFGTTYIINSETEITAEIEKNSQIDNIIAKIGIKYAINKSLIILCGTRNKPFTISFGSGFYIKNFQIDFSFSRHELLGWMPSSSVSWNFP